MPNHVINEIRVRKAMVKDLAGIAVNHDGFVDFSLLLPIPLNFWQGSEGLEHEQNFVGLGMKWSRENWGTKWNAYGQDEGDRYKSVVQEGDDVVLTFQTAWSFPRGWVTALFNKTGKTLECAYLSEGMTDGYNETFICDPENKMNHIRWGTTKIDEGSDEHKRLHKLLWGVEDFCDESA